MKEPDQTPTLADLIARLENAKQGGHTLNCLIHAALGRPDTHIPADYTTSLDAALTLVPDGWAYRIQRNLNGGCFAELQGPEAAQLSHTGDYPTSALALCIAALRARSTS